VERVAPAIVVRRVADAAGRRRSRPLSTVN
jgi:hypothetical protein